MSGYKTIKKGMVHSMTPPNIQEKINALDIEKRKLQKLADIKGQLEILDNTRAAMVIEYDILAVELGEDRIGTRKRITDEEVQECRKDILGATMTPQHMNSVVEMLSSKYEASTIRNQAKNLIDEGKLTKIGDRGPTVMYVNSAKFTALQPST
jgi:hypothetical protein